MRFVIDLQACQRPVVEDGFRRRALALASALAAEVGEDELWVVLSTRWPSTVDIARHALSTAIPRERVLTYALPPAPAAGDRAGRAVWFEIAGAIRAGVLRDLGTAAVVALESPAGEDNALAATDDRSVPLIVAALDAGIPAISNGALRARAQALLLWLADDDTTRTAAPESGPSLRRTLDCHATPGDAARALMKLLRETLPSLIPSTAATIRRPRLAFVAPLPPERTGVAEYCANLLPALVAHYEIELVTDQARVDLPVGAPAFPVRNYDWFRLNADTFERVLYNFGNSPFHKDMQTLLERHPGTAAMHDFFLGDLVHWLDESGSAPGTFRRTLYESHGYEAMGFDASHSRRETIDRYPCNRPVLERADGIIVHSQFALEAAHRAYAGPIGYDYAVGGLARPSADHPMRAAARHRLGLADNEFVAASFGFIGGTKLNDRLLAAWIQSAPGRNRRGRLVFVGQGHSDDYHRALQEAIAAAPHPECVTITGFADAARYEDWLAAADVAVQLRGASRGETSGAALDCLAHGLPTIVNRCGSLAELPRNVVVSLPEVFADADLAGALEGLYSDRALRDSLQSAALRHIEELHAPAVVAAQYRDAIERFFLTSARRRYDELISSVALRLPAGDAEDLPALAAAIAANLPQRGPVQLLVDISTLVNQDLRSGIERVVRSVLGQLLEHPPAGMRVEPVRALNGTYHYARAFTCTWLGVEPPDLPDEPVDAASHDVFIGLDWTPQTTPQCLGTLREWRARGVYLSFVVYDLLPERLPHCFPPGLPEFHATWLSAVTAVADQALCISRAVAADLARWMETESIDRAAPLAIAHFVLGADIARSVPSTGLPADTEAILARIAERPSLLMVGTIEPRKGHVQAFAAFERLWRDSIDLGLVIVGRRGWMMDGLLERISRHPEYGRRVLLLESASDELLERIYGACQGLLAASLGEGFGLPLVEAAQRGLPIIARDLPVFREVAGDHALYFEGRDATDLMMALRRWLDLRNAHALPASQGIAWRTWAQSADDLVAALRERRVDHYAPKHSSMAAPSTHARPVRVFDFGMPHWPRVLAAVTGLSEFETWGRWSDQRLAPTVRLQLCDPLPARGTLHVTARAYGPNVNAPIAVHIGDGRHEIRVGPEDTDASLSFETDGECHVIEFIPPSPRAPADDGSSPDRRRLGIGLLRVSVHASD